MTYRADKVYSKNKNFTYRNNKNQTIGSDNHFCSHGSMQMPEEKILYRFSSKNKHKDMLNQDLKVQTTLDTAKSPGFRRNSFKKIASKRERNVENRYISIDHRFKKVRLKRIYNNSICKSFSEKLLKKKFFCRLHAVNSILKRCESHSENAHFRISHVKKIDYCDKEVGKQTEQIKILCSNENKNMTFENSSKICKETYKQGIQNQLGLYKDFMIDDFRIIKDDCGKFSVQKPQLKGVTRIIDIPHTHNDKDALEKIFSFDKDCTTYDNSKLDVQTPLKGKPVAYLNIKGKLNDLLNFTTNTRIQDTKFGGFSTMQKQNANFKSRAVLEKTMHNDIEYKTCFNNNCFKILNENGWDGIYSRKSLKDIKNTEFPHSKLFRKREVCSSVSSIEMARDNDDSDCDLQNNVVKKIEKASFTSSGSEKKDSKDKRENYMRPLNHNDSLLNDFGNKNIKELSVANARKMDFAKKIRIQSASTFSDRKDDSILQSEINPCGFYSQINELDSWGENKTSCKIGKNDGVFTDKSTIQSQKALTNSADIQTENSSTFQHQLQSNANKYFSASQYFKGYNGRNLFSFSEKKYDKAKDKFPFQNDLQTHAYNRHKDSSYYGINENKDLRGMPKIAYKNCTEFSKTNVNKDFTSQKSQKISGNELSFFDPSAVVASSKSLGKTGHKTLKSNLYSSNRDLNQKTDTSKSFMQKRYFYKPKDLNQAHSNRTQFELPKTYIADPKLPFNGVNTQFYTTDAKKRRDDQKIPVYQVTPNPFEPKKNKELEFRCKDRVSSFKIRDMPNDQQRRYGYEIYTGFDKNHRYVSHHELKESANVSSNSANSQKTQMQNFSKNQLKYQPYGFKMRNHDANEKFMHEYPSVVGDRLLKSNYRVIDHVFDTRKKKPDYNLHPHTGKVDAKSGYKNIYDTLSRQHHESKPSANTNLNHFKSKIDPDRSPKNSVSPQKHMNGVEYENMHSRFFTSKPTTMKDYSKDKIGSKSTQKDENEVVLSSINKKNIHRKDFLTPNPLNFNSNMQSDYFLSSDRAENSPKNTSHESCIFLGQNSSPRQKSISQGISNKHGDSQMQAPMKTTSVSKSASDSPATKSANQQENYGLGHTRESKLQDSGDDSKFYFKSPSMAPSMNISDGADRPSSNCDTSENKKSSDDSTPKILPIPVDCELNASSLSQTNDQHPQNAVSAVSDKSETSSDRKAVPSDVHLSRNNDIRKVAETHLSHPDIKNCAGAPMRIPHVAYGYNYVPKHVSNAFPTGYPIPFQRGETGFYNEKGGVVGMKNEEPDLSDAMAYLAKVKQEFAHDEAIYDTFLELMRDYKQAKIDACSVLRAVTGLFKGKPALIEGFNGFLPKQFKIDEDNPIRSGKLGYRGQGLYPQNPRFYSEKHSGPFSKDSFAESRNMYDGLFDNDSKYVRDAREKMLNKEQMQRLDPRMHQERHKYELSTRRGLDLDPRPFPYSKWRSPTDFSRMTKDPYVLEGNKPDLKHKYASPDLLRDKEAQKSDFGQYKQARRHSKDEKAFDARLEEETSHKEKFEDFIRQRRFEDAEERRAEGSALDKRSNANYAGEKNEKESDNRMYSRKNDSKPPHSDYKPLRDLTKDASSVYSKAADPNRDRRSTDNAESDRKQPTDESDRNKFSSRDLCEKHPRIMTREGSESSRAFHLHKSHVDTRFTTDDGFEHEGTRRMDGYKEKSTLNMKNSRDIENFPTSKSAYDRLQRDLEIKNHYRRVSRDAGSLKYDEITSNYERRSVSHRFSRNDKSDQIILENATKDHFRDLHNYSRMRSPKQSDYYEKYRDLDRKDSQMYAKKRFAEDVQEHPRFSDFRRKYSRIDTRSFSKELTRPLDSFLRRADRPKHLYDDKNRQDSQSQLRSDLKDRNIDELAAKRSGDNERGYSGYRIPMHDDFKHYSRSSQSKYLSDRTSSKYSQETSLGNDHAASYRNFSSARISESRSNSRRSRQDIDFVKDSSNSRQDLGFLDAISQGVSDLADSKDFTPDGHKQRTADLHKNRSNPPPLEMSQNDENLAKSRSTESQEELSRTSQKYSQKETSDPDDASHSSRTKQGPVSKGSPGLETEKSTTQRQEDQKPNAVDAEDHLEMKAPKKSIGHGTSEREEQANRDSAWTKDRAIFESKPDYHSQRSQERFYDQNHPQVKDSREYTHRKQNIPGLYYDQPPERFHEHRYPSNQAHDKFSHLDYPRDPVWARDHDRSLYHRNFAKNPDSFYYDRPQNNPYSAERRSSELKKIDENAKQRKALSFVQKVKRRLNERPADYKNFIEILQQYQKNPSDPNRILTMLKDILISHEDLLDEFAEFVPQVRSVMSREDFESIRARKSMAKEFYDEYAPEYTDQQHTDRKRSAHGDRKASNYAEKVIRRQSALHNEFISDHLKTKQTGFAIDEKMHDSTEINSKAADSTANDCNIHDSREENISNHKKNQELLTKIVTALQKHKCIDPFLKCLNMYNQDLISARDLITLLAPVLNDNDLLEAFKRYIRYKEKKLPSYLVKTLASYPKMPTQRNMIYADQAIKDLRDQISEIKGKVSGHIDFPTFDPLKTDLVLFIHKMLLQSLVDPTNPLILKYRQLLIKTTGKISNISPVDDSEHEDFHEYYTHKSSQLNTFLKTFSLQKNNFMLKNILIMLLSSNFSDKLNALKKKLFVGSSIEIHMQTLLEDITFYIINNLTKSISLHKTFNCQQSNNENAVVSPLEQPKSKRFKNPSQVYGKEKTNSLIENSIASKVISNTSFIQNMMLLNYFNTNTQSLVHINIREKSNALKFLLIKFSKGFDYDYLNTFLPRKTDILRTSFKVRLTTPGIINKDFTEISPIQSTNISKNNNPDRLNQNSDFYKYSSESLQNRGGGKSPRKSIKSVCTGTQSSSSSSIGSKKNSESLNADFIYALKYLDHVLNDPNLNNFLKKHLITNSTIHKIFSIDKSTLFCYGDRNTYSAGYYVNLNNGETGYFINPTLELLHNVDKIVAANAPTSYRLLPVNDRFYINEQALKNSDSVESKTILESEASIKNNCELDRENSEQNAGLEITETTASSSQKDKLDERNCLRNVFSPLKHANLLPENVLNDYCISCPTLESEDSQFINSRKIIYEELNFRLEDERYEQDLYRVRLESLILALENYENQNDLFSCEKASDHTDASLDLDELQSDCEKIANGEQSNNTHVDDLKPLNIEDLQNLDENNKEKSEAESQASQLEKDQEKELEEQAISEDDSENGDPEIFGGFITHSIVKEILESIYGFRHTEIYAGMLKRPKKCIPLVLKRLYSVLQIHKLKVRNKNKKWREIAERNFYKALDPSILTLKAKDKKHLSARKIELDSQISNIAVYQDVKSILNIYVLHNSDTSTKKMLNLVYEFMEGKDSHKCVSLPFAAVLKLILTLYARLSNLKSQLEKDSIKEDHLYPHYDKKSSYQEKNNSIELGKNSTKNSIKDKASQSESYTKDENTHSLSLDVDTADTLGKEDIRNFNSDQFFKGALEANEFTNAVEIMLNLKNQDSDASECTKNTEHILKAIKRSCYHSKNILQNKSASLIGYINNQDKPQGVLASSITNNDLSSGMAIYESNQTSVTLQSSFFSSTPKRNVYSNATNIHIDQTCDDYNITCAAAKYIPALDLDIMSEKEIYKMSINHSRYKEILDQIILLITNKIDYTTYDENIRVISDAKAYNLSNVEKILHKISRQSETFFNNPDLAKLIVKYSLDFAFLRAIQEDAYCNVSKTSNSFKIIKLESDEQGCQKCDFMNLLHEKQIECITEEITDTLFLSDDNVLTDLCTLELDSQTNIADLEIHEKDLLQLVKLKFSTLQHSSYCEILHTRIEKLAKRHEGMQRIKKRELMNENHMSMNLISVINSKNLHVSFLANTNDFFARKAAYKRSAIRRAKACIK